MTASILDGKLVASKLKITLKDAIANRSLKGLRPPGLAVILVGNNEASKIYVNNKRELCKEVGIKSLAYDLPEKTTEDELIDLIKQLNNSDEIDGILVQLPLPAHISSSNILEHISPKKDVDGFHPFNLGRLAQGNPLLRPCTPFGIIQLLNYYDINLLGKHAVIVGASNIVGRPMALELLLAKATVTICHSATKNLNEHISVADIIVVAAGSYNVVKPNWLNSEQVLIDVGIHRHQNGDIHGDVDFNKAIKKVKWITPVPGGIGPMTIATLLQNTMYAANIK